MRRMSYAGLAGLALALAPVRWRHGGIPLASLPRTMFRQLTSHRSYSNRSKYQ